MVLTLLQNIEGNIMKRKKSLGIYYNAYKTKSGKLRIQRVSTSRGPEQNIDLSRDKAKELKKFLNNKFDFRK